jgi:hypothetical protein
MAKDRRFPHLMSVWASDEIRDGLQAAQASYKAILPGCTLSDAGRIAWQEWLRWRGFLPGPQAAQAQPQQTAQPFSSPFQAPTMNGVTDGR